MATQGQLSSPQLWLLEQAKKETQKQQHQFQQQTLNALWEAHEAMQESVAAAMEAVILAQKAMEQAQRARTAVRECIRKLNELSG